jgi:hypothetical protein
MVSSGKRDLQARSYTFRILRRAELINKPRDTLYIALDLEDLNGNTILELRECLCLVWY